jgi:hypothetical protein
MGSFYRYPKPSEKNTIFRYYLFDSSGVLKSADANIMATDFAAIEFGQQLLANSTGFTAIEIWRDERFVAGWQLDGAPHMPKPAAKKMARHPMMASVYADRS